ncbi:nuclear transport factor 2 family protein [Allosediminivita pacifica]|uniref:SnoaL-like domain-containing protein n=1 Tax=Allosediminivita pacifica TaxID=1267769 RepID=A0A2T6ABM9_9RHOB|nr:nuclear transport factor 2 family protein [Allosediminivita pacifica]PTX41187.1 hypothetical protein C8N44_13128 [Allosediminivita pacifica]GGB24574.1 hypothetical protein GCM10011324_38190 [Allosediminivita pacifica]
MSGHTGTPAQGKGAPAAGRRDAVAAVRAQYQAVLDDMRTALEAGDTAAYARHFSLPLVTSNMDGSVRTETAEELSEVVADYLDIYARRGIARVEQRCEAARIDPSGCLEGYHLTRFFGEGANGTEVAHSRFVMTREDDAWKVIRLETGLERSMWPMRPDRFEPIPGRDLTDDQFTAYSIVQAMLNITTLHVLNGDAEGFAQGALFPIFVQSRQGRYTIDDIEALRKDMALYREEFQIHGVDDVYRPLKSAEFVGPDKITGTYRTYILSRGGLVVEPYESALTLQRCEDGRWRTTSIMHGLGHLNWR